jgi:diguanylate cyclase (GGDEF)-like protein
VNPRGPGAGGNLDSGRVMPPPAAPVPADGLPVAPRRGWRLATRIVVMSLLLLLLVQAAGFVAIHASIERNARSNLADDLVVAERIWKRLLEQRAAKLGQGASLLASDFGFRAAVNSDDRETISSALDNHGARIDAAVTALLDTQHAVRSVSHGAPADVAAELASLAPRLAQKQGSALAEIRGRPHQFVMVPMRSPLVIGWVLMGFELDGSVVRDLHAISGLHVTLVVVPPAVSAAGAAGTGAVLHTSLSSGAEATLLAALPGGTAEAQVAGSPVLLRDVPLEDGGTVLLRLSGSLAQAIAPYKALQVTLAALTAIGLLLFGVGSQWTASRISRPLNELVEASRRMSRGDYDTALAPALLRQGARDEVGALARAFEHMRGSIAAQQRQIRELAYWDRLTGLPNRVQFRDAVLAATERGGPLAVVMLDLDRFKHVNDVLGYAFGDRLLQGVAQRLQQVVRPCDVVSRLGGDEFALLLPGADAELAQSVTARIAAAFEEPLTLDDQRVDLSAGLGIACWPAHAADADTLLSRAEVAMYVAKRRTAGAQLYDPSLDNGSAQTLSLLSELRHAVENNELRLFLQPKVALATGALVGAEALVRWQHPQRGLVPPMEFIPFAEQTGFVRQLTLWVFEETARSQALLAELGVERVSINLSTRDLMDLELPDKLEAILLRHGVRADAFCLEITESAIMDDPARAEGTLNRLAARGYKLSIDDFGTGYSSLAYLKRLPVQELKIDKSFVMGMAREEGDAKIVRSTIDLAHNLGLSVVAEGVENADIQRRLAEQGCDEAQGYHLSKPVPLAALQAWAAQHGHRRVALIPAHPEFGATLH